MRLFKRGDSPYLWCEFYIPGQAEPVRKSTKQSDRRLALQAAQELARQAAVPRAPETDDTVKTVLLGYLASLESSDAADGTCTTYSNRAAQLILHLGDEIAARLTRERIDGYIQARRFAVRKVARPYGAEEPAEKRAAPGTIKLELVVLGAALRWAKERRIVVYDPREIMPKFKVKKKKRAAYRWLTEAEFAALYQHYAARFPYRAPWLAIACLTGMRKEEIHDFRVADVFFCRDEIHCRGDKTERSDRWIPIAPQLRPMLASLCEGREPDDLVVPRWRGVSGPEGLPGGCKAVGIPRATAHDLRRTFASWLLQRGVPERTIADLLGHQGTQLVREVYGHLGGADYKRAIAVLGPAPRPQRTDSVRNEGPDPARTDGNETTEIALSPLGSRTSVTDGEDKSLHRIIFGAVNLRRGQRGGGRRRTDSVRPRLRLCR